MHNNNNNNIGTAALFLCGCWSVNNNRIWNKHNFFFFYFLLYFGLTKLFCDKTLLKYCCMYLYCCCCCYEFFWIIIFWLFISALLLVLQLPPSCLNLKQPFNKKKAFWGRKTTAAAAADTPASFSAKIIRSPRVLCLNIHPQTLDSGHSLLALPSQQWWKWGVHRSHTKKLLD